MPTNGTPEQAVKRCGQEIARLRTRRRWSRPKLIARLYDELDPNDPSVDTISESWLKRLENGDMVKVPRQILEALCRALRCTQRERARVLLYADRNGLVGAEHPDAIAEILHYTIIHLYDATHDLLTNLIGQRRADELDDQEMFELIHAALEVVLAQHKPSAHR